MMNISLLARETFLNISFRALSYVFFKLKITMKVFNGNVKKSMIILKKASKNLINFY